MRIAVLALTEVGLRTARRLAAELEDATVLDARGRMAATLEQAWQNYDGLVCLMALGIVVRLLSPLLRDKYTDPAVVVCDEQGRFAIAVLSGHIGGANLLARQVAGCLGGQAVITTASDGRGRTALDLWLRDRAMTVPDRKGLTRIMARLLEAGSIQVYSEVELGALPPDLRLTTDRESADLVVTWREEAGTSGVVVHPAVLVAGIGCNRHTPAEEIGQAVQEACAAHGLARESIAGLASIDLKRDEPGLLAFARANRYSVEFFDRDQLNGVEGIRPSEAVYRATGARGVAEPAAILAARGPLLVPKMKWKNVTVAIALRGGVQKKTGEQ